VAALAFARGLGRARIPVTELETRSGASRSIEDYIQNSPDAFLRVDPMGLVVFANPSARAMLGLGDHDLGSLSFSGLSPHVIGIGCAKSSSPSNPFLDLHLSNSSASPPTED